MHLFYCSSEEFESQFLNKEESHHASRVLRLNPGDSILISQGNGIIYQAQIKGLSKSKLEFYQVEVFSQEEKPNHLHIAIAPTKGLDRFEFFLEKATEVGVNEISPIIAFHSERKIYKTERGKKIILSAAKQSRSHWKTHLNEPQALSDFLKKATHENKFIAHCEDSDQKMNLLASLSNFKNALVLIGPEGDFSSQEIEQALKSGFKAVSLGSKRLRTETAGIAVSIASKILY